MENSMMKKKWHQTVPCVHNEGVKCRHPGKCQGCGRDPAVAQARTEAFEQRFKKG